MSYELPWRRQHPGHLVYLIDLSGSMGVSVNGKSMIETVLDPVYKIFRNLQSQCESGDDILNYFSVSVYGYNTDIVPLLEAKNSEEFYEFCEAVDRRGYLFDITKEAKPQWQTYMASAFDTAAADISKWIAAQRAAGLKVPAPVVINITDGFPEEKGLTREQAVSKALESARKLREIKADDGEVLLFNIHFTSKADRPSMALPSSAPADPDTRFLFEASSIVPAKGVEVARNLWPKSNVTSQSRVMISNETNVRALLHFIDFGSSLSMPSGGNSFVETAKPD